MKIKVSFTLTAYENRSLFYFNVFFVVKSEVEYIFVSRYWNPSIIRKNFKFPDYRGFLVHVDENGCRI